jgi:signal transduction histidine kinase
MARCFGRRPATDAQPANTAGTGRTTVTPGHEVRTMSSLSAFIRERRDAILDRWVSRAASLPAASESDARDHLPAMLDHLADAVDRRDESARPLEDLPQQHATLRFREGYDLRQVVAEYRLLRSVVMDLYTEQGDTTVRAGNLMPPLAVMHEAIDRAIGDAVDQYALERDRVRETFIAMLGHDLREPLHAMVFSAETLTRTPSDAPTMNIVRRIIANAQRMDRMIRDLLDFARTRLDGGFAITPVPVDARALTARATHDVMHAHPERSVQNLADTAPGDFLVEWDNDRVAQVVTNLVTNALVHGSDPVTVEPVDEGDHVTIRVTNAGEIPRELVPHLFDAFGSKADHKKREGLGIGLYIVRQVALAHGGTVDAVSAAGQTTVSVRMPRYARHTRTHPEA